MPKSGNFMELLAVRMGVVIIMLCIMGYLDFRTRLVDDRIFIAFGIIAGSIYVFDHSLDGFDILMLVSSLIIATVGWRIGFIYTGDYLALILVAVLMPTFAGLLPTTIVMLILAMLVTAVMSIVANVVLNISEWRHGMLFDGIKSGMLWKAFGFILYHRHRNYEHHVNVSETPDGKLKMFKQEYYEHKTSIPIGKYVQYVFPWMTVMAGISIFFGIILYL